MFDSSISVRKWFASLRSEPSDVVAVSTIVVKSGVQSMMSRRIRVICYSVALFSSAAGMPGAAPAQSAPGLTMSALSMRAIALDFDAGRNMIYCYYGLAVPNELAIRVDSLQVVTSPSDCRGVGFGFISRLTDKPMLEAMLRGLIAAHPDFRIISAFYGTEPVEVGGQSIRAARALSVLRPGRAAAAMFGS